MTEISPKEFGRLQSDVKHLKETTDAHTVILEEIRQNTAGAISRKEYEDNKRGTVARLDDHEERIEAIERRHETIDASFSKKVTQAFTNNLVKFFAASLFTFTLLMVVVVVNHNLNTDNPVGSVKKIIEESNNKN